VGSAARFNYPSGITVDGSGTLYVTDSHNQTIREISASGVVTTLAGYPGSTGTTDGIGNGARFNQPAGITLDGSGNLYVVDNTNDSIREVTPAGVVTTV